MNMKPGYLFLSSSCVLMLLACQSFPLVVLDRNPTDASAPLTPTSKGERQPLTPTSKGERRIAGRLLSAFKISDAVSQQTPVPQALFQVKQVATSQIFETTSDRDGNFAFEAGLPDGEYRVMVTADVAQQRLVQQVGRFTVQGGKSATELLFVVGTGAIKGQAKLNGVSDYSDITVAILNANIPPARTDSQGRFTFYNVPQALADGEEKELRFSKEGFQPATLKVKTILAGQETRLTEEVTLLPAPMASSSASPQAGVVVTVGAPVVNVTTGNVQVGTPQPTPTPSIKP